MSSKEKEVWAILAQISPCRWEVNEKSHIPLENFKISPFVIKSVLKSNCKRFRKSAKRENFNQKPEAQKKETHSNISANFTHQYKAVKENLNPLSFIYVWTIFEHQVKDMYASQKLQTLSNLRSP